VACRLCPPAPRPATKSHRTNYRRDRQILDAATWAGWTLTNRLR
jgi:hypothetical protein